MLHSNRRPDNIYDGPVLFNIDDKDYSSFSSYETVLPSSL